MEETKRLHRSESNRIIAGVCGGLGEFFGIDATLVRLLFVLFAFFGGGGIIAYIVMWLLVPTQSKVNTAPRDVPREGFEEMREGIERGAREAKQVYERWRGHGDEAGGEATEAPPSGQPPAGQGVPGDQPLEPPPPPAPPPGDQGPRVEPPGPPPAPPLSDEPPGEGPPTDQPPGEEPPRS